MKSNQKPKQNTEENSFDHILHMIETYGEEIYETVGQQLDNAFDFMEHVFGESQEMVVFITELNASHFALWFISENGCDKYYTYNQGLLLGERQQSIMADIQGIEKELSLLV